MPADRGDDGSGGPPTRRSAAAPQRRYQRPRIVVAIARWGRGRRAAAGPQHLAVCRCATGRRAADLDDAKASAGAPIPAPAHRGCHRPVGSRPSSRRRPAAPRGMPLRHWSARGRPRRREGVRRNRRKAREQPRARRRQHCTSVGGYAKRRDRPGLAIGRPPGRARRNARSYRASKARAIMAQGSPRPQP